jgi:DNA-binding transcriptional regulator of glucitol operon
MHDMFAQPSLAASAAHQVSCKPDPAGTSDAAAAGATDSATPPSAAAAGDQPGTSMGNMFSSSSEEFHWVRTGTLAIAAAMSCGAVVLAWAQWSAYGQLSWVCTHGMKLPIPAGLAGKVQVATADATVCPGGVAVAYSLQQQPSTVLVAQLQGNPVHAQYALVEPNTQPLQLPVVQAGSHNLAQHGCHVTALSWDQSSSNSLRLACVSADVNSGTAADAAAGGSNSSARLTLLSMQQGQLQQQAQAPCAAAAASQQLVWLLDGLLLWSGGSNMQLFTLDSLQEAAVKFAAPAARFKAPAPPPAAGGGDSSCGRRSLCALAASPHGVGVAAVMELSSASRGSSSSSRLLLYNVPPTGLATTSSSSSSNEGVLASPKPVASRLLWALMQQKHTWDVVQHTLCAARVPASTSSSITTAAAVQPEAVGQVLSLVDSKLAVQQPTLKSTFSARWDVLKLALLSGTPGDVARVVGIDLRLRINSHMMKPVFDVMREVSVCCSGPVALYCVLFVLADLCGDVEKGQRAERHNRQAPWLEAG